MARVLVTGGRGFVGSHLVDRLVQRGDEVTVFDATPPPPGEASSPVRFLTGDIRDQAQLAEAVTADTDTIYHFAAVVGVDQYLARPLDVIDINLLGTRNVLELAGKVDAKVLVASTSEVFGKNPAVPWREDADRILGSTEIDRWSYSTSKALAEHLTFTFARAHGLRATILRYFNVYGPRQRPAFVVSRTVHRALNGKPPVRYDDGGQTRCFTFVDDAIEATITAATSEKTDGESFNVGSMVETTVAQVIELVGELTGGGTEAVAAAPGDRAGYQDLRRRVPDTTKIREVLGWRCTTQLRDGLARTIEWARANQWWLDRQDSGSG
jgi:UDP-glucose 4-epimerase